MFFFFLILCLGYQGQITAAFVSLKIGCVLCEDCALCHLEILGKECSDVHSMQEHSSIPLFDAKLHPMTMAVGIVFEYSNIC